jgi:hypothetical protein
VNERPDLARRAAAEGFGTFALVFAGCGAIVTEATSPGSIGVVGITLVFGLIVNGDGHNRSARGYQLVRGEHPRDPATETA